MHRAGTSPFPPGSPAPKTTTTHSLLSSSLTGHAWCLPRASPQRIDSSPCLPPTTGNASASPARVTSSSPGSRSWAGPCRRARACRSCPGSCSTPATASGPRCSPRPTWSSPSGHRSTRRSRREGARCCRAGCCSTSCAACLRDPCRSRSRRVAGSRRSRPAPASTSCTPTAPTTTPSFPRSTASGCSPSSARPSSRRSSASSTRRPATRPARCSQASTSSSASAR